MKTECLKRGSQDCIRRFFIETADVDARLKPFARKDIFSNRRELLDPHGFLREECKGKAGVKDIAAIAGTGGAIIIAESGMGKSVCAKEFCRNNSNEATLLLLQDFANDVEGLKETLRERKTVRYICVDGLDEAPELVAPLCRLLAESMDTQRPLIFSRNVVKVEFVHTKLQLPIYSLLPFSEEDAGCVGEGLGANRKKFMRQVITNGLGPVCAKPITCELLAKSFCEGGQVELDGGRLWQDTIHRLCMENSSNAFHIGGKPVATCEDCEVYAAKMALALKLTGKGSIARVTNGDAPVSALRISEYGEVFDHEKVEDVLMRGLFLPIGTDRFRFVHSTYFDYFAACGIRDYISRENWEEILFSTNDEVYPQWEGVAAWLAVWDKGILDRLLSWSPELLLMSERTIKVVGMEKMCKALLDRAESLDYWRRGDIMSMSRYCKLSCEGSVNILKKILDDPHTPDPKLEMAIDIARSFGTESANVILADVFCNKNMELRHRTHAGYALMESAGLDVKRKCKRILADPTCDRNLKVTLFHLAWPEAMSAEEMTAHLTAREDRTIDSYDMWIGYYMPHTFKRLSRQQALDLLRWSARDVSRGQGDTYHLEELKRKIFTYCWNTYQDPEAMALMADAYYAFTTEYIEPFYVAEQDGEDPFSITMEQFADNKKSRRELARTIVGMLEANIESIFFFEAPLLDGRDLDIVEKWAEKSAGDVQRRWVRCLRELLLRISPWADSHIKNWDRFRREYPEEFCVAACEILEERKRTEREVSARRAERDRKAQERDEQNKKNALAYKEWVRTHTGANGAPDDFHGVMIFLFGRQLGSITSEKFDLRKNERWQSLDLGVRDSIKIDAIRFLENCNGPWSTDQSCYPAYGLTFCFLHVASPMSLAKLDKEVWRKFAPELFRIAEFDYFKAFAPVMERFAKLQPDIFTDALLDHIRMCLGQNRNLSLGDVCMAMASDAGICREVFARCERGAVPRGDVFTVLDAFWKSNPDEVLAHINRTKRYSRLRADEDLRMTSFIFAAAPASFSRWLKKMERDPERAREWSRCVIGRRDWPNVSAWAFADHLGLEEKCRLYILLARLYAPSSRPMLDGPIDETDCIYSFMNELFQSLIREKRPGLAKAIRTMIKALPDEKWMRDYELKASREELESLSARFSDGEVIRMIVTHGVGVIVNTPRKLLEVVERALNQYQVFLTGKSSPQVGMLWNEQKDGSLRHKDEESFSDHIKVFLERELKDIVFNREVQLNRGRMNKPGSRTDIWVNKPVAGRTPLALCIEVKGSWNESVHVAVKNQLVGKYMGEGGAEAGILLLGWFAARRMQHKNVYKNKKEATKELSGQVQEVECKGKLVSHHVIDCSY